MARATEEVLRDHLRYRQAGDLAGDIAQNYAEDVIILTMEGVFMAPRAYARTAPSFAATSRARRSASR